MVVNSKVLIELGLLKILLTTPFKFFLYYLFCNNSKCTLHVLQPASGANIP